MLFYSTSFTLSGIEIKRAIRPMISGEKLGLPVLFSIPESILNKNQTLQFVRLVELVNIYAELTESQHLLLKCRTVPHQSLLVLISDLCTLKRFLKLIADPTY